VVRDAHAAVPLARRPVLFALARLLAEAWPRDVPRDELIARVFRARRPDDSHRVRLRVEIGRLRRALQGLAGIVATPGGYALRPHRQGAPIVLARPVDEPHAAVLALLADGEAWSSSALALALDASQRTVQRALDALAAAGKAQALGHGRARRWVAPPMPGFAPSLLLPMALPEGWHGSRQPHAATSEERTMNRSAAEIIGEYGPFPGVEDVHGVSYDGRHVWVATGRQLHAMDPDNGTLGRAIDVAADAGTAFDGRHLYQIAGERIQKIDPRTGEVVGTIPAPSVAGNSGLAWAEGSLWVGRYPEHKIVQVDPATGAILRTIESNRYVTGVTWVDGELWHGTWEEDASDLRRLDPRSGEVLDVLEMPAGTGV